MSVQIIDVTCPTCRHFGSARWVVDSKAPFPRKLAALTAGFCSIERGDGREADIRCMRCNDTHVAGAEARTALSA
jgi:hypothetical protein